MYPQRWSASETTIGQNKTLVTDAGPSRGSILRSGEPDLVLQEFYAWLTAGQLVRKAVYDTAAQAAGKPVETAQVSFTATRHAADHPDPGHRHHQPRRPDRCHRNRQPRGPDPPAHPRP